MHASSLLKTVLKPRNIPSSSNSKSRGARPASPDSMVSSVNINKKSSTGSSSSKSPPAKMSCLCAPTNHAGSFRCRLHRGEQQSWGGKPLAPAGSKPPTAPAKAPATAPVSAPTENKALRRSSASASTPNMLYLPVRSPDMRPSRLSKVSGADDDHSAVQADGSVPFSSADIKKEPMRYLKMAHESTKASDAFDGGIHFVKKLQTGGKKTVNVFGSGSRMSTELSL